MIHHSRSELWVVPKPGPAFFIRCLRDHDPYDKEGTRLREVNGRRRHEGLGGRRDALTTKETSVPLNSVSLD